MDELEPELLWPLLLVQIVYDELVQKSGAGAAGTRAAAGSGADFGAVAKAYASHPLLPSSAPLLTTARDAEKLYDELLRENKVDASLAPIVRAQVLAEPLYAKFHEHLVATMDKDVEEFEKAYRRLESARDIPRDERLAEAPPGST